MPDVGTKTRPLADLSLALTSRDQRDRNWLHSVSRFLAGQSVVRSLLRTHDPDPRPPVTFSRQRQSVAISPYAGYVLRDNEFYAFAMSDDGQPCATSCPRVSGLQICDHCKSAISWYFGTLSRQVTELILHCQPVGSFLVRNSSSRCGTFALSVRVQQDAERPTGVAHYLLIKSAKSRVQIKGFESDFDCVQNLLLHYSRNSERLPCKLRLGAESGSGTDNAYHNDLRLAALAILTRS